MVPGVVVAFAGNTVPDGWELCAGQMVSKNVPKYARLFEAIGTIHDGDGNPMFKLPDYRGMFLRGVDRGSGRDPDAGSRNAPGENNSGNSGDLVGSVQGHQFQSHEHAVVPLMVGHTNSGNGHEHRISSDDGPNWNDFRLQLTTDKRGGNETRPRNAYVHYIVKL